MSSLLESQYTTAQRMYTPRAADYEQSWHPDYTKRFMALVDIQPDHRVLSLACGTGLEAEVAAPKITGGGLFVGVDATENMLDEFRKKLAKDDALNKRVKLHQHDVTDLTGCEGVELDSFDWIICSNAFVLFKNPAEVVAHWRRYLKPGGRMVIDITHEYNLRQGLVMEKVAEKLGLEYPSNRSWIKSERSFRKILEDNNFEVEKSKLLEKESGKGSYFIDASKARDEYEDITTSRFTRMFTSDEIRSKGLPIFEKEWNAIAVDGKVEVSDTLYVYVARKI